MQESSVIQVIFDALEMLNHTREDNNQISISEHTELFGTQGNLDSMELVGILIDIEEAMQDEGFSVSLSDDRAMSQTQSPFMNVRSLVDYIQTLISSGST